MFEFVAIVGSREYARYDLVAAYVEALPPNAIVVTGGARGVDSIAMSVARKRGLGVLVFEAVWRNKYAGFARNERVVEICQRLVAFWDGSSPGTRDAFTRARRLEKPVEVYGPTGKRQD